MKIVTGLGESCQTGGRPAVKPRWISRNMRERINLDDKEALYAAPDNRRNSADIKSVRP